MPRVTILPVDLSADVSPNDSLLDAGNAAGIEMEAGCFNCSCGTCAVAVVSGMENLSPPTPEEVKVLESWDRNPAQHRLACCTRVIHAGQVVVRQLR